jgi:Phosphotransferase enzyme family
VRRTGYAYVPLPGGAKAIVSADDPAPARYYARLLGEALRYGLPGRRTPATLFLAAARSPTPERLAAAVLRRFRRRAEPRVDHLLSELHAHWPEHAGTRPAQLRALGLQRAAGLTVFVFGDGPTPILVAKLPGDEATLAREAKALEAASAAGVAPLPLGLIGGAYVQEALEGTPLRVDAELTWTAEHEELATGLARLAGATRTEGVPPELGWDPDRMPADARASLEDAASALEHLGRTVLRHGDTSAQNCLFRGGRLVGLVDWERAQPAGAPGFDVWNSALAALEHGVGLRRWSEGRVLSTFADGWRYSEWGRRVDHAARRSVEASGVSPALARPLELAFFARRLERRLANPPVYATGPRVAARMLELVCAR